jgi:cysteine desulfurase
MSDNTIYLDHAAATPLDERVFRAMEPYFSKVFYNPSAPYMAGRDARRDLEDARHRLAMVIGAKKDEIILTAGATESVNLAVRGVLSSGGHAVIGATEHQAVAQAVQPYSHSIAVATSKGIITPEAVVAVVTDETVLVSITAADSELGVVQPLQKIAAALDAIREDRRSRGLKRPLYFHSDASQAAGALDLHVSRLGVDMLTLNAAKCYGPKQVGLLWLRSNIQLEPIVRGGGQERGLRAGTEYLAGAVGFAAALEFAQAERHTEGKRLAGLRDKLEKDLTFALPELVVNGHPKRRLPGHLNVSLDGLDAERVIFRLDENGIMAATGAACAANKDTRSSVLEAIGLADSLSDGSLRFTLGKLIDEPMIDRAVPLIITAIKEEAAR